MEEDKAVLSEDHMSSLTTFFPFLFFFPFFIYYGRTNGFVSFDHFTIHIGMSRFLRIRFLNFQFLSENQTCHKCSHASCVAQLLPYRIISKIEQNYYKETEKRSPFSLNETVTFSCDMSEIRARHFCFFNLTKSHFRFKLRQRHLFASHFLQSQFFSSFSSFKYVPNYFSSFICI